MNFFLIFELLMMYFGINGLMLFFTILELDVTYRRGGKDALIRFCDKKPSTYSRVLTYLLCPLAVYVGHVFDKFYKERALG